MLFAQRLKKKKHHNSILSSPAVGRIKKNKETTENAENAEKQIDFFRDFCSCQKLIVVERLSGETCQLLGVCNTEKRRKKVFIFNLRGLSGLGGENNLRVRKACADIYVRLR